MIKSFPERKVQTLYIDTWLFKYLKQVAEFNDEGEFVVKGTILIPADSHRHKNRFIQFFSKGQNKSQLRILSRQSKIDRLYGLMRYYRRCFYRDMINYAAARYGIMFAKDALREFLRNMDIYESDYSTEAAYKKWQRSREYEELKGSNVFSTVSGNIQVYNKVKEILENEYNQQQSRG